METIIPDESFGALYRRGRVPPSLSIDSFIDQLVESSSSGFVEIIGPHQSRKTKLLSQIAVRCILPRSYDGLERVVVMIDLDHKMDVQALISQLQKHIQDDSLLEECLQRFQLISCDSTFEFLATLRVLPTILSTDGGSMSPLGCILIDNWNAFLAMENAKSTLKDIPMTLQSVQKSMFLSMEELQSFQVPIIVTKFNSIPVKNRDEGKEPWDQIGLNQRPFQDFFARQFYLAPFQQVSNSIKNQLGLFNGISEHHSIVIKSILPESPPKRLDFEG